MIIPRLYTFIGGGIALLLVVAFVALHIRADNRLRDAHETLQGEAGVVLEATRQAADNPDLEWAQAPGQIVALGESRRTLLVSVDRQNQRINELAADAVAARAEAAELQRLADRAQAQRRAALDMLSDMSATPGTRGDCMQLLAEAEEALDLVRGAGL